MYSRLQCTTTCPPGPAVLSVSRDRSLLLTRKAVLRRAGFTVNAVTSYKEAVSIAHNARPVVAILDQTIPWREREKLATALKKAHHSIRVVEIAVGTDPCPLRSVDGILGSPEGPEVLVAAVRE